MKVLKVFADAINLDDLEVMKKCWESDEYVKLLKSTAEFYSTDMIYFHDSTFSVLSEKQTHVVTTVVELYANCDLDNHEIHKHVVTFTGKHDKLRKFNASLIEGMFFEPNDNGSYKVHIIFMKKTNCKRFYYSFSTDKIEYKLN